MGRFFDFVEEHGPGFAALMRGGPAGGSSTADVLIDGVRQAAYEQIIAHLDVSAPPARLELVVRSWVSLAESTALLWLDGRRIPRAELELQLVHDFAALAAVSAAYDQEMAGIVLRVFAQEPHGRPLRRSADASLRPGARRTRRPAAAAALGPNPCGRTRPGPGPRPRRGR